MKNVGSNYFGRYTAVDRIKLDILQLTRHESTTIRQLSIW